MRHVGIAIWSLLLALYGIVSGSNQFVSDNHLRVFLFGQAAYFSEVAIDLVNNTCLGLDNNMLVHSSAIWRLLTSVGLTGKCNLYSSAVTTSGMSTIGVMTGIASSTSKDPWIHFG